MWGGLPTCKPGMSVYRVHAWCLRRHWVSWDWLQKDAGKLPLGTDIWARVLWENRQYSLLTTGTCLQSPQISHVCLFWGRVSLYSPGCPWTERPACLWLLELKVCSTMSSFKSYFWSYNFFTFFSPETRFSLVVLALTLKSRLVSNSQTSACLFFPSAGVKGVPHHWPARIYSFFLF